MTENFKTLKKILNIMGIFNKLKFWGHKDDDLDFDSLTSQEMNPSEAPNNLGLQADPIGLDNDPFLTESQTPNPLSDPLMQPGVPPTNPTAQPLKIPSEQMENKDLELISS